MSINVIKPGLATTVQDLGREGHYHLGIPPSGAMDQFSARVANMLVGNSEECAVLEGALIAPELQFTSDTIVAICGARMTPFVDGVEMPLDTSFTVKAGQTLKFSYPKLGARVYIAFAGGIQLPDMLGSLSTYALGALGGYEGRKLEAGDVIDLGKPSPLAKEGVTVPAELLLPIEKESQLRVVPGLYNHRLTEESEQRFYSETWTVASEADRIGYRFKGGHPLEFKSREQPFGAGSDPSNIVDACYPIGSIQVPAGKEPIVLHRDAVSGGGYLTIGTVISVDLDLIGQMQPNYKTKFVPVTLEEALLARKERQAVLESIRKLLTQ
ncbi:biotin-dependent carboxyltransferase family protein [Vibrio viridaestus]|uniref:Biotin-dependent carboxyltransferase n=1 Tax=Vibrio viridaestus TaxID=2487322 RepID=A0A3N9TK32_9VIBR|nr:biotin-dependent carboxyltransferase family protein [Vibrio viridaestus]RQW64324.1 biotin-dependent carboxyltransferase [Vibrio viridaestus]